MNVVETAAKISSMELRGAGKIARSAAEALKKFLMEYSKSDPECFKADFLKARDTLKNTRPTAVSLENALNTVINGAMGETVEEIKQSGIKAAERFIENSNNAVEKVAELIAEKIDPGYTVLTHCNSTVVVKGLIKAHQQNKEIHVFATETRPWGQGYITSKILADSGVDVTLIVDSAARFFMTECGVDLVLFGADTITRDGTLINKIGTSQLAVIANEELIPVYACAESYKFSTTAETGAQVTIEERDVSEIIEPTELPGVKLQNPVFDRTPPKYIKAIITEFGEISTLDVKGFIEKLNSG